MRMSEISRFCVTLILFFVVLVSGCAEDQPVHIDDAQTREVFITDDILSDEVWQPDRGNYIIQKEIRIHSDVTLSILPGTIVKFDPDTGLVVEGKLIVGTPLSQERVGKSVLFTASSDFPEPGAWQGVQFENTNDTASTIRGAVIEYARIGISAISSSPTIMDCTSRLNDIGISLNQSISPIEHNDIQSNRVGIQISGGSPYEGALRISENNITHNEEGVIYARISYMAPIELTRNNFNDNLGYAIRLQSPHKVAMPHNFWGSTNQASIDRFIFDRNDDMFLREHDLRRMDRGVAVYEPIAAEPIAEAGPRKRE